MGRRGRNRPRGLSLIDDDDDDDDDICKIFVLLKHPNLNIKFQN